MCGIAGLIDVAGGLDQPLRVLSEMGSALAHRGPDGRGEWFDPVARVGLAHRRLAIIDLSEQGAQPMTSACGRFVCVLNGEIYDYKDIRAELEAQGTVSSWRGHSDTEVLLEAIAAWGIERALRKINGMFALAVVDRRERQLHLARDRFGEKPLYYCWHGSRFSFASELAALERVPGWQGTVDVAAAQAFLAYCYVPTPMSIYLGVRKLPAASLLTVPLDAAGSADSRITEFWSAIETAAGARARGIDSSIDAVPELVDQELRRAVGLRMHADVPLGAFLSGGIDSSLVVAMMQQLSSRRVRTFSIGLADARFDESGHARAVANHLGTDHTEFTVTAHDMLHVVPQLATVYGEPFADSSQIPTILVARLARQQVTVALSGDGGDELFGGYSRHVVSGSLATALRLGPHSLRRALGAVLRRIPVESWDGIAAGLARRLGRPAVRLFGHKVHKFSRAVATSTHKDLYDELVTFWGGAAQLRSPASRGNAWALPSDFRLGEMMMALDTVTYLPDDILVKVDRATMSVGLEGRVPFLDPRLFELAWRLPFQSRIHGGLGKRVLRDVLYRHVPRELVDRPKAGFAVPIGEWIRGPLRDWAENHLRAGALADAGLYDVATVRRTWQSHLAGRDGMEHHLWAVLMLQSWLTHRAVGGRQLMQTA